MRFSKFAGNQPVCKSTDLKRKSAFLLWDTPYFILYSSLFLQKYPMFDEQVNYNLETPIRVLPDKYKTCLWEVLKLYGASTTFESEMYNICMKDVLLLLRAIIQLFSAFSRYPLLWRHLRMKLKGLNAKCQHFIGEGCVQPRFDSKEPQEWIVVGDIVPARRRYKSNVQDI